MTKEDANKLMTLLRASFPNSPQYKGDTAAAAWYVMLSHLPYDQVRAAVLEIARAGQFPPAPFDVLRRLPTPITEPAKPARRSITYEDFARMVSYLPPEESAEIMAKVDARRKAAPHDT